MFVLRSVVVDTLLFRQNGVHFLDNFKKNFFAFAIDVAEKFMQVFAFQYNMAKQWM